MTSSSLPDQIADIVYRIAELERRARNRRRKGTIDEVSDDGSKYRVKLSEQNSKPYRTDWIKPRIIAAGGVKVDVRYSKGEQVDVVSENGDMTDAQIDFSTYSDDNPRENKDAALHIKIGETVIEASGGQAKVSSPIVIVSSADVRLGGEGGEKVARVGDRVKIDTGSSAGLWPIVEGSSSVTAA